MSDTRRLFFALWPPDGVRAVLANRSRAVRAACSGRFVPDANLHLTLAFLGAVPDADLKGVTGAAAQVRTAPFVLTLSRGTLWRRSGILSLVPMRVPESLTDLHQALGHALSSHGLRAERRRYRPHVTLARDAKCAGDLPSVEPVEWPVDAFVLVQSLSGSRAPRYVPLARFDLQAV